MRALYNGKIILEDKILENKVLLINSKIYKIIDKSDFNSNDEDEVIDVKGKYISPGFIDIHIHGSGGRDTMDGSLEDLETIGKTILSYGTTGFLPTTMTMDMKDIHHTLNVIGEAMNKSMEGAKVLGAHMEGPFINKKYKGAQNENYIKTPTKKYIEKYLDIIKIITMAPEVEGGMEFIEDLRSYKNITLSIGHTNASYEEAMEAIEKGISHATHTFNAMTGLHHRDPGAVGAVFNSPISCELIADKIHIHPHLFNLLLNVKEADQLVLITDAMRAGCMKEGIYDLGGQQVVVKDQSARLKSGSLAGSVLTLNQAVRNFMKETEIPLYEAVKLASLNPAKVIGMGDRMGSIKEGKDADIIVFDESINIHKVFVDGDLKYSK